MIETALLYGGRVQRRRLRACMPTWAPAYAGKKGLHTCLRRTVALG